MVAVNAAVALNQPVVESMEAAAGRPVLTEKLAPVHAKLAQLVNSNTSKMKAYRKETPSYPMALSSTAPVGPHFPKASWALSE